MVLLILQDVVKKPTTQKHAVNPLDWHKGKTTHRLPVRRKQRGNATREIAREPKKTKKKRDNFPEFSAWAINFAGVLENCFFVVLLFLGFLVSFVFFGVFVCMVFVVFFEMYLAVGCGRLQGLYSFCNSCLYLVCLGARKIRKKAHSQGGPFCYFNIS